MSPRDLEPAPTPNLSWTKLMQHSRNSRNEIRAALHQNFTKWSLVATEHGCKMFALGTPANSSSQTLLAVDIPLAQLDQIAGESGPNMKPATLCLQPVFKNDPFRNSMPSLEFSLMCERQRSSVVHGVTDYSVQSGNILMIGGEQIFKYSPSRELLCPINLNLNDQQDDERMEEEHPIDVSPPKSGYISDAKICPVDSRYVAYVLNKQVHIEKDGTIIYATKYEANVSNGVPSYICLEELERFEGIWWSAKEKRLLYERVDESMVAEAQFCMNGNKPEPAMKYPRVYDVPLKRDLHQILPSMEYITRAGFFSDGKTIYVQMMSRQQHECALILVPEWDFDLPPMVVFGKNVKCSNSIDYDFGTWCAQSSAAFDMPTSPLPPPTRLKPGALRTTVPIHKINSEHWINVHNATVPLPIENDNEPIYQFIYCRETRFGSCLTHLSVTLNQHGSPCNVVESELMKRNHSICKSIQAKIDEKRKLVYFVANESHPIEWNVCVSSYAANHLAYPMTKRLTEADMSFRFERANSNLAVEFDIGFVCWMTSQKVPPVCRFYRFRHTDVLPDAVFAAQVTVPGFAMVPELNVDFPEIVEYTSPKTGFTHFGMIMKPSNFDATKKYPVLQYVYGGPGIQVIHNDFCSWLPFIKFTRLGYIVVVLDNRGSANRGIEFEAQISRKLGYAEVDDQIEGLHILAEHSGGIMDLSRVVVQGWSYGGFMSLLLLAGNGHIYRGAIAGGAVTDWRLYDTAYTERYLGYPVYSEIYYKSSVLRLADSLPDEPNRLLLIHGLMDENVHFSHLCALVDTCIRKGKPYDLLVFPNERHGIRNADAAAYLDAKMMYFMQKALNEPIERPITTNTTTTATIPNW
ncbi:unnamed protein product [Caenorhabditis bovis]|uniref:Uncharacterized protein n=1 Tax=Caenorhabditis bovis TaxID=2654633 RepID=A0A8S1FDN1_9PELO|nr:unnamed protein product [Caenorhabditis bovis]